MGLDTTHNAYHGCYSTFTDMRQALVKAYNDTDLRQYYGYSKHGEINEGLLLETIEDKGLYILCNHSDCDGELTPDECYEVAKSILLLSDKIENDWYKELALTFAEGCQLAHKNGETLEFH